MSLTIDRFLRVILPESPTAVQAQDQSIAMYATDQYSDQFIDGLYMAASSQTEVEQTFGTASEIAKATAKAFGHPSSRPRVLYIGYWNKNGDPVLARSNSLTATQSPVAFVNLKSSYDFQITSRNISEQVAYTSTAAVTDYDSFVVALNEALGDESRFEFTYSNGVFSLKSKVNGKDVDTDNIDLIGDIADDLRLTLNRGVKKIRGLDAIAGTVQTPTDFISALENKMPNFFGFYSSVALSDSEIIEFHDRLQAGAKKRIFAFTALADYLLDFDQSNPLYQIAKKESRIMLCQLNKLNDKHAAVSLLVEACSTNWNGINTAKTNKFKRQATTQSDAGIDTNIANKCDRLGINYYTDYDGTSFLAEGRTVGTEMWFIDSTVGRFAYADRLQAAAATRLTRQPKIPQTDIGQSTLEGSLIAVHERFVRNGFLGENLIWNGLGFGELQTGDVLTKGWYMYSDSFQLQTQPDREARKGMPIQVAAKEAGAIHDADIIVYLER